MATLKQLARDGLTGFSPDWEDYSGRAYRWRAKTKAQGGHLRTWPIGDWFERASDCDYFRSLISRGEWRDFVASGLVDGSEEVSVEIVYKDFDGGRAAGRLAILRGTSYPVARRGGDAVIQWTKGRAYERTENLPPLGGGDVFDAQVSRNIRWYVFVWDREGEGRWRHIASFALEAHLDGFVDWLRKQGEGVRVVDKPEL